MVCKGFRVDFRGRIYVVCKGFRVHVRDRGSFVVDVRGLEFEGWRVGSWKLSVVVWSW